MKLFSGAFHAAQSLEHVGLAPLDVRKAVEGSIRRTAIEGFSAAVECQDLSGSPGEMEGKGSVICKTIERSGTLLDELPTENPVRALVEKCPCLLTAPRSGHVTNRAFSDLDLLRYRSTNHSGLEWERLTSPDRCIVPEQYPGWLECLVECGDDRFRHGLETSRQDLNHEPPL